MKEEVVIMRMVGWIDKRGNCDLKLVRRRRRAEAMNRERMEVKQ